MRFQFVSDRSDTKFYWGYRLWGDALPEKLNGMFAFAIYDRVRRRVFLARDRFGEKPLYYAPHSDGLIFGSDLGVIRAHESISGTLDPEGLRKYFAYGFFPAPATVYKGVCKLPHGHSMDIEATSGMVKTKAYWRYALDPTPTLRKEADLVEELRHLLSQAVKRRLMSDVPIGVFLSGGIDSSAIAAYAANHLGAARLNTFCLGFNDVSYDESKFARALAEVIGCKHFETKLSLQQAINTLPGVLESLDEPIGDPSILPTYLLCRFARQKVTVALGGDGGDELFAGYDPFLALRPARLYSALVPDRLHRMITRLMERRTVPTIHGTRL